MVENEDSKVHPKDLNRKIRSLQAPKRIVDGTLSTDHNYTGFLVLTGTFQYTYSFKCCI